MKLGFVLRHPILTAQALRMMRWLCRWAGHDYAMGVPNCWRCGHAADPS